MLNFFFISILTIVKLGSVVGIGIFASRYLSKPKESISGITYILLRVFIPCLIFSNLASKLSWNILFQRGYYWAVIFSFVPIISGFSLSYFVLRHIIPNHRELHGLFILSSTFQNTIYFGLAIISTLYGIKWLEEEGVVEDCRMVLFLYNIACSVLISSFGGWIVKRGKEEEKEALWKAERNYARRKEIRRKYKEATERTANEADTLRGSSEPVQETQDYVNLEAIDETPIGCSVAPKRRLWRISRRHLGDEREGRITYSSSSSMSDITCESQIEDGSSRVISNTGNDYFTRIARINSQDGDHQRDVTLATSFTDGMEGVGRIKSVRELILEAFTNIAVIASLTGVLAALCPPLSYIMNVSIPGRIMMGVFIIFSNAAVPFILVMMGITVLSPIVEGRASLSIFTERRLKEEMFVEGNTDVRLGDITVDRRVTTSEEGPSLGELRSRKKGRLQRHAIRRARAMGHGADSHVAGIEDVHLPFMFVLLIIITRLVIIPMVSFAIITLIEYYMWDYVPQNRAFRFVILLMSCAPTSLSTLMTCVLNDYKAMEYSRVLFLTYVPCIFSTVSWLTFYLWYLGNESATGYKKVN
eukprot:Tbor_TRINITY_DN2326_c0_g1::TRINITY_DN2326_c0_g1_i1::g.122::m.122